MFAGCVPGIFSSRRKVALWITLLFICIGEINAGDTETVVGKVGNPVFLHPSKLPGNVHEVKWKTPYKIVGKLKDGNLQCGSRYKIFPNGSLRIDSANKNDTAIYMLELFDGNGENTATKSIKLSIQDDVSVPVVHTSCTVDGRVKLICSVQHGNEVTVHWIVHSAWSNHTLDSATANRRILYLRRQTPGYLVCVASNRVSQNFSLPVSMACRAHIFSLAALGLFLLLPTLALAAAMLKKKDTNVPRKDEEHCYVAMQKKTAPPKHDNDAEHCYVAMQKKTAPPKHDNDAENCYVAMQKKTAPPKHDNDAENCYVAMQKKTAPPKHDNDAEHCYIAMHKKATPPADHDSVNCNPTLPRLNEDGDEHTVEPVIEDVYV
ncbi:T-cell surface antigen CD2-like isoform X2 [Anguilla rostrata]|uniref:T-cell surface antigen CD2-like isoform X2 n=1 Tax=Anguilla rostrata TaxID=7938 RepID=UPI0030D1938E